MSRRARGAALPTLGSNPSHADSGDRPIGRSFDVIAGRYEILAMIGAGGMGAVYRARDTALDEVVALKMLPSDVVRRVDAVERFRREVKLSRRVTHRNVARVFDIGEHGADVFFTMELIDGESLGALVRRSAPLRTQRVLEIGVALAEALGAAHAAGVVHRDLKPDNVVVSREGRIVVTDFGIAYSLEATDARRTGNLVGTPYYMAPEQVDRRHAIDARADYYALGVLLFEASTGALPFSGETPLAIAVARLFGEPPDPRAKRPIPDGLAEVILKLMAVKPGDRFASSDDIIAALERVQPSDPGSTTSAPSTPRSRDGGRRGESPGTTPATPGRVMRDARALVVLPLKNRGHADDAYLADGLTDDLTDSLSMLRGLRVLSRSVLGDLTHGSAQSTYEHLRARGDAHVAVEGSVQRIKSGAEGKVRVNLRAISVADGIQLWAHRFEEADGDLLRVNETAAAAIASALTIEANVSRRRLEDPIAIDLYLKARAQMGAMWASGLGLAAGYLEEALVREPDSPILLAAYAVVLARRFFFTGSGEERARDAAEAAIAAAPDAAEAHFAVASVAYQAADFEAAAQAIQRAIEISPLYLDALILRARIISEVGPIDDAESALRRVLSLDPREWLAHRELARIDALRARWEEFDARLDAMASGMPPSEGETTRTMLRLRAASWRKDPAVLEQAATAALQYSDPNQLGPIAVALEISRAIVSGTSLAGPVASLRDGQAGAGGSRRRAFFAQMSTEIAASRDDQDEMYASLEASTDLGLIDLVWLDHCALFDAHREDPRFVAARSRILARAAKIRAAMRRQPRG